jgi:two-component system LytT family response regulator
VTAHDQYAIRAFEISAADYLLKPVTEERFRVAFERAKRRLCAAKPDESARQMLTVLEAIANPRRYLSRLAIRSGDRTIFLPVGDVEWIEAAQNYVRVHAGEATHLVHVPMNTIEYSLDPERFLRVHRSYIVNLQRVKQFWTLAHGQYVLELSSGERLETAGRMGNGSAVCFRIRSNGWQAGGNAPDKCTGTPSPNPWDLSFLETRLMSRMISAHMSAHRR